MILTDTLTTIARAVLVEIPLEICPFTSIAIIIKTYHFCDNDIPQFTKKNWQVAVIKGYQI